MQMQELQIKQQDVQRKAEADMARIQLDMQKAMAKAQLDQQRLEQQERMETARLGVKISETNTQEELEERKLRHRIKWQVLSLALKSPKRLWAVDHGTRHVIVEIKYQNQMNEIADHLSGGGCKDFADYQKCCGIIQGLAWAEKRSFGSSVQV